jgi:hypothetical protein
LDDDTSRDGRGGELVRYYPAHNWLAVARAPLGFVVVGMDVDECSVMLRVMHQSPDDPYMVARRIVTVPLAQGADGELLVGTVHVSNADSDVEEQTDALF